jgi:hypothetical protein
MLTDDLIWTETIRVNGQQMPNPFPEEDLEKLREWVSKTQRDHPSLDIRISPWNGKRELCFVSTI